MKETVEKIKSGKKYRNISDGVVEREVVMFLNGSGYELGDVGEVEVVKEVRKRLHLKYASFQTKGKKKIEKYLDELEVLRKGGKDVLDFEIIDKLLSVSLSTKERLDLYEEIYSKIFEITGKPKVIVDLGGGLNAFSYSYMGLSSVKYYSYDIDDEDVRLLEKYFDVMSNEGKGSGLKGKSFGGLKGKAGILDVRDFSEVEKLPKSDVVFLFKVVDVIDDKGHKISEELIEKLFDKTKFVVVSFATRTLTRQRMNHPNRKWFELVCSRKGWEFKRLEFDNEVFYVVKN